MIPELWVFYYILFPICGALILFTAWYVNKDRIKWNGKFGFKLIERPNQNIMLPEDFTKEEMKELVQYFKTEDYSDELISNILSKKKNE